jgi:hypothetical protein
MTHHKCVPETAGRHTKKMFYRNRISDLSYFVFKGLNPFSSYSSRWLLKFATATEHINASSYKNHKSKLMFNILVRYFTKLYCSGYSAY